MTKASPSPSSSKNPVFEEVAKASSSSSSSSSKKPVFVLVLAKLEALKNEMKDVKSAVVALKKIAEEEKQQKTLERAIKYKLTKLLSFDYYVGESRQCSRPRVS